MAREERKAKKAAKSAKKGESKDLGKARKQWRALEDEIDREFAGAKDGGTVTDLPFLHIAVGADRKSVVLTPDPAAEP